MGIFVFLFVCFLLDAQTPLQFQEAPFQIEVSERQEVSGENLGQGLVPMVPVLLGSYG